MERQRQGRGVRRDVCGGREDLSTGLQHVEGLGEQGGEGAADGSGDEGCGDRG